MFNTNNDCQLEAYLYRNNSQTETISQFTYSKYLTDILNFFGNQWRTGYLAKLSKSHNFNKKSMSSNFIVSENVVILKYSSISGPYWEHPMAESIIVSKDKKVRRLMSDFLIPMFLRDLLICLTQLKPLRSEI